MTTTELKCDTCGHTTKMDDATGPTEAQQAEHEAAAGSSAESWGDHHIMWPTGR